MRKAPSDDLNRCRVRDGYMGSGDDYGMAGAFVITGPTGSRIAIISSGVDEQHGWEHVSVSLKHRVPTWAEMCLVKDLFWDEEEVVMQLHPMKSQYVDDHPNCLHLWRPLREVIPMPPLVLL